MRIDYDHHADERWHTLIGAREALRIIFPDQFPESVLDVGCGSGTWLAAALERGARQIVGVDGGELPPTLLHVPPACVRRVDLSEPLDLGRRFALVLCLETAEHLEQDYAAILVDSLVRHGDRILFSAAVPGQPGTHHVNCQWPAYWQELFNNRGYVCTDAVRWSIWDNEQIEPWYRQNLLLLERDEKSAGKEPRIRSVVHPGVFQLPVADRLREIEQGGLPFLWYAVTPFSVAAAKLRRALGRISRSARRRKVTPRA